MERTPGRAGECENGSNKVIPSKQQREKWEEWTEFQGLEQKI